VFRLEDGFGRVDLIEFERKRKLFGLGKNVLI